MESPPIIPTRHRKDKVPKTHTYPLGAKMISEVLAGVPQFDQLTIDFGMSIRWQLSRTFDSVSGVAGYIRGRDRAGSFLKPWMKPVTTGRNGRSELTLFRARSGTPYRPNWSQPRCQQSGRGSWPIRIRMNGRIFTLLYSCGGRSLGQEVDGRFQQAAEQCPCGPATGVSRFLRPWTSG